MFRSLGPPKLNVPADDPAVFMSPNADPACLGAMSSALQHVPNWWKPLANMASVARNSAGSYESRRPGTLERD